MPSYNATLDMEESTVYGETLQNALGSLGQDPATEVSYSVSIQGADMSDFMNDVERIEIVGGEYDGVDGAGDPYQDDGGTRTYLENEDVAVFDQSTVLSQTSTGPNTYKLSTTNGDLQVSEKPSGNAVMCSGDAFDDAVLEGDSDYAFKARILDDSGSTLTETPWELPDYETFETDDVQYKAEQARGAVEDLNNMDWGSLINRFL